jgi:FkbM family methyltransferase
MNMLHKLAWSVSTAGPIETLKGLARLASDRVLTKEGIELAYATNAQRPTLLVISGCYCDPEYPYFATLGVKGWRVVDVGAGIGQFAIYLAKCGAFVTAFEPNQANRFQLRHNLEANQVNALVNVRSIALGSHLQAQIHISNDGLNSHVGHIKGGELAHVSTLDDQYPEGEIDLLKINTAGSEWEVLHGATKLLMQKRVRYLCVLDGLKMRTKIPELAAYGYSWFVMDHSGRIWNIPANGPVTKPAFCRHLLAVRR